jgi:signal transduction histidine kinase
MKIRLTLDIRRAFIALSGVVLLILAGLTGISVLLIWDSKTRLEPLHQQAAVLADAQSQILDVLALHQTLADLGQGKGRSDVEEKRRDDLMRSMDATVQQVTGTLGALRSAQGDYAHLTEVTAVGVAVLVLALLGLSVIARERILKPLGKLAHLITRLAQEDYRPEPLDGLDAFIRPAFDSYNRLVGRLAYLERAHQARHERMEIQVREAAGALVAQRAELARIERLAAVGEVAAALSHEVRNPLAAIGAACRSLIEDAKDEDSRARLRMIDDEVGRLVDLVNRQLRRTRHHPEEPEPVDLTRLVRNLVSLMNNQMPGTIDMRTDLPRRLMARLPPNGLRQALLNLLRNAQEAQGEAGGNIAVSVREGETGIEIQVEDAGPGFSEELLAAGVQRFLSGKSEGTGLGLAMVERFVRDLGGALRIENRPEGGARVRLLLPPATVQVPPA